MISYWHYNISKNKIRRKNMSLDGIIAKLEYCTDIQLLPEKHDSISLIRKNVFYIEPNFKVFEENLNAKFILFSAPGATGKTALAEYLAHKKNGVYWDLSHIKLGENSLHGTLARALGYDKIPDFINKLNNGNATLVIDAFDEADLISGRAAIEFLLKDLDEITKQSIKPSIIMLARTESSMFISEFCKANNINYSYFEISYFSETSAKHFIIESLKKNEKPITDVVKQCIEQQFTTIKHLLDGKVDLFDTFIGYAPVLQALTVAYDEEKNTVKLLNTLLEVEKGSEIVYKIIEELLDREHKKMCNALQQRWIKEYPDFNQWDNIYTIEEQLIHIICLISFSDFEDFTNVKEYMPDAIYSDYIESLPNFLSQHPFLISKDNSGKIIKDFAGPAFRDFTLAFLLTSEAFMYLAIEYLTMGDNISQRPSQLLFDFYLHYNNEKISSNIFIYLYESFKSKESTDRTVSLSIYDDGDNTVSRFLLQESDNKIILEQSMEIEIKENGLLLKEASNTTIDVNCEVHIANSSGSAQIYNTSIICRKLFFDSADIWIGVKEPNECILVSKEPVYYTHNIKYDIRTENTKSLKISFPNINEFHKLRPYFYNYLDEANVDFIKYEFIVKKFTNCLRGHKKDTPARDKEFIDFTIVGHSELKKNILDFLLFEGVFYIDPRESHLYKLKVDKLDSIGLSYWSSNDDLKNREEGYSKFLKWQQNNQ